MFEKLRLMSTIELVNLLSTFNEQENRNLIIYELTYRMYIPFKGISFDELLLQNGYVPLEQKEKRI